MERRDLIAILEEIHPEVDYETESALIDSGIFDSMDILTLIAEIAAQFEIKVPANEIIAENFNSASALFLLLEELE